jgi:hypothetical protein
MIYRKLGVVFILVGLFIPLAIYPFTDLGDNAIGQQAMAHFSGAAYSPRMSDLVIVLSESESYYGRNRETVPYKYFLSGGVIFIFAGIALFIFSKNKFTIHYGGKTQNSEIEGRHLIENINKERKTSLNTKTLFNTLIYILAATAILTFSYYFLTYEKPSSSSIDNSNLNAIRWVIKGGIALIIVYIGIQKARK